MRFGLLTAVVLAAAPVAAADDDSQAREVVDRAIAQIGGAKKLTNLKAGVWKTSGTVRGVPSRAEFHGELPGKFRLDSTRAVDGKPTRFSRIINGDKGWVVEGEKVKPMSDEEMAHVRESFYHKRIATTLLPLTDKACKLSVVGQADVGGRPATAIRATRAGFPDVTLYFDQQTGLLAKTEMTGKDAAGGKGRKVELLLSDYKEFDGVKMAGRTKTYHDGKLFLDTELVEFHRADSLPGKTFDAP
ncbi:MAG TPA: hypothetical protein VFG68_00705 [Fimbriiglobus sp.]|nr:hypothetical protein [Fimbriiglobus sp.]